MHQDRPEYFVRDIQDVCLSSIFLSGKVYHSCHPRTAYFCSYTYRNRCIHRTHTSWEITISIRHGQIKHPIVSITNDPLCQSLNTNTSSTTVSLYPRLQPTMPSTPAHETTPKLPQRSTFSEHPHTPRPSEGCDNHADSHVRNPLTAAEALSPSSAALKLRSPAEPNTSSSVGLEIQSPVLIPRLPVASTLRTFKPLTAPHKPRLGAMIAVTPAS